MPRVHPVMSSMFQHHQHVWDDKHKKYAIRADDAEIAAKSIRLSVRYYWRPLIEIITNRFEQQVHKL